MDSEWELIYVEGSEILYQQCQMDDLGGQILMADNHVTSI